MNAALPSAVAAATAALLVLPARAGVPARPRARARGGRLVLPVSVAAAVLGCCTLLDGRHLVLGLLLVAAGAGAWRLVDLSRRQRRADQRAGRVLEACDAIAADLAAGQTPSAALDRAATDWAELAPVAAACRLDADVPRALRQLATVAGAEELRTVAAAWQVAHRSGSGLADALAGTADAIRARRRTLRTVATELAAARATARMMALLPVLVLGLGSGLGVDPWGFLTGTPVGLGCLAAGMSLAGLGMLWIQRIADGVLHR